MRRVAALLLVLAGGSVAAGTLPYYAVVTEEHLAEGIQLNSGNVVSVRREKDGVAWVHLYLGDESEIPVPQAKLEPTAAFPRLRTLPKKCFIEDPEGDCNADFTLNTDGTFSVVSWCMESDKVQRKGALFGDGPFIVGRFSDGMEVGFAQFQLKDAGTCP